MHNLKMHKIGHESLASIFQFRRTKSRVRFDNIFWFISLVSTTKKKFPEINLHDSELMTHVHVHGRQLQNCIFTYNIIIDGWKFQWQFELLHRKFY